MPFICFRNSADSINPDVSGRSNSDDNGSDGDDIAGGCNTISKEDPDLEHLVVMINCNEYENVGERFDIIAKKLRKVLYVFEWVINNNKRNW